MLLQILDPPLPPLAPHYYHCSILMIAVYRQGSDHVQQVMCTTTQQQQQQQQQLTHSLTHSLILILTLIIAHYQVKWPSDDILLCRLLWC